VAWRSVFPSAHPFHPRLSVFVVLLPGVQFPEIVVSVARKTDAALWPALFAAVGSPRRLCQGLMESDKLQVRVWVRVSAAQVGS